MMANDESRGTAPFSSMEGGLGEQSLREALIELPTAAL
jgi:hypothetical protein